MHIAHLLVVLFLGAVSTAQQITPVQVLKISAGPVGAESNGVFALTEERSVFSRGTDREVIVFFQWENLPGAHKLVAQWRSADGGTTSSSSIDYHASDKRFGAYWRLPVTADIPLGTWSIEATMDGRPAGRYSFEITDANVATAVSRRPLTHAELYAHLNQFFVLLRRGAADGRELEPAAGFLPAPQTGRIYTVVPAIDATETLRAVTSNGTTHQITKLVAWNRRQQWAVVQGQPAPGEALRVAPSEELKIGSQCFSIEGTAAGVRVLVVGTLSGQAETAGLRVLIATFPRAFGMPGAPVVDEYGALLGIVGAGLPGDSRPVDNIAEARGTLNGAPVIPFAAVTAPAAAAGLDLVALLAAGDLMPPLTGANHIASGSFTRGPVKRGDAAGGEPVKEFSLRDQMIGVVVTWSPSERVRGSAVLRVLDSENKIIGVSQPRKVNFDKGNVARSSWDLPMLATPGVYRVDLAVDARTLWRGFFRINP
jgi:hypothetical protein